MGAAMKVFFRVHVSGYWEDPALVSVWEHSIEDDAGDYASEHLGCIMDREAWLELIPLPARLNDRDFRIVGVCVITGSYDYITGEYDSDESFEEVKYKSWPADMAIPGITTSDYPMTSLD
jgi:hypothetical protein